MSHRETRPSNNDKWGRNRYGRTAILQYCSYVVTSVNVVVSLYGDPLCGGEADHWQTNTSGIVKPLEGNNTVVRSVVGKNC